MKSQQQVAKMVKLGLHAYKKFNYMNQPNDSSCVNELMKKENTLQQQDLK